VLLIDQASLWFKLLITSSILQRGYLFRVLVHLQSCHSLPNPEYISALDLHRDQPYFRNILGPKTYDLENFAGSGYSAQKPLSHSSPSGISVSTIRNTSEVLPNTYGYDRYKPSLLRSLFLYIHRVCVVSARCPSEAYRKQLFSGTSVSKQHGTCIPRLYALICYLSRLNSLPIVFEHEKLDLLKYRSGVLFLYYGITISILTGIAGGLALE
jgi:hypothetical protein